MGIEIRQLVVKTDVVEGGEEGEKNGTEKVVGIRGCELDAIKEDVLGECKEWLLDRHIENGER